MCSSSTFLLKDLNTCFFDHRVLSSKQVSFFKFSIEESTSSSRFGTDVEEEKDFGVNIGVLTWSSRSTGMTFFGI
jgi:hypothetical protein